MVCPYTWDVPGGVQEHIKDLAEALIGLGHEVSVISPADDDTPLAGYVVPAGRAVPVPYNGSVARLAFRPLSAARVRGWIAVSEAARTTLVEHMGGDAVLIPNGVTVSRYEKASPLPGWPGEGGVLGFLGRMEEPRKGLDVLLRAFELLAARRPGLRLLVAGPGDLDEVRAK